nr:MAG: putative RNA-dependent RNA polymerase [Picobirnavirus sp.]
MKKEKPSLGNYFKLPNPGLWAYFKHNVSGQPDDYRPPFWNKMDRSKVLQLWQDVVDAYDLEGKLPELYSFEQDMKSKVGPMSIQLPLADRIESIEQYYTCVQDAGEPISKDAILETCKFFSKAGGLHLRGKLEVVSNMRLNTNSGSWLFTKRRNVVAETLSATLKSYQNHEPVALITKQIPQFSYMTEEDVQKRYDLCAVLGWRGQEGGITDDDVKQRVVWMMPFLLNIKELQFYQPAIQSFQKNDLIPAYISMDRVDQEVTALFDTKSNDDLVICTDFTKFDQHFNPNLQNAAKEVIQSLMTKGDVSCQQWLDEIYPIKFNISLICSEDLLYTGPHGMGSGSGGTNFDECLAHKALQFESALENHQTLNPHSMAYGDDGILTYPGISVDSVIQTYTKHGLEMNGSKQYVSKHDCVVLRRWHGMNYRVNGTMVGIYSTFRALGRLLAQERFYDPEKWNSELVTLRALSILENCKWHPMFHQFIDFVLLGDKYRLGLDIPGFFDRLESTAKDAIEQFTDFLGYTKNLQEDAKQTTTGINDWEVVKYLKTLRK